MVMVKLSNHGKSLNNHRPIGLLLQFYTLIQPISVLLQFFFALFMVTSKQHNTGTTLVMWLWLLSYLFCNINSFIYVQHLHSNGILHVHMEPFIYKFNGSVHLQMWPHLEMRHFIYKWNPYLYKWDTSFTNGTPQILAQTTPHSILSEEPLPV